MRHVGFYFPYQGLTPCPVNWKYGVLTTGPPETSLKCWHLQGVPGCRALGKLSFTKDSSPVTVAKHPPLGDCLDSRNQC